MNNYTIRRSTRAKKIKLVAKPEGGVELVLPRFIPEIVGKAFASLHTEWIEKQIKKSENKLPLIPTEDGAAIFFLGSPAYRLQIEPTQKKSSWEKKSESLVVYLTTEDFSSKKKSKIIADLVENFYRTEAQKHLTERTHILAKKLEVSFERITIRGQKTRWGSCSRKGNLNYNWKIMKELPGVVDYLVIHELCHRKEMNHSRTFWDHVAKFDPDYKKHRKLLSGKY